MLADFSRKLAGRPCLSRAQRLAALIRLVVCVIRNYDDPGKSKLSENGRIARNRNFCAWVSRSFPCATAQQALLGTAIPLKGQRAVSLSDSIGGIGQCRG